MIHRLHLLIVLCATATISLGATAQAPSVRGDGTVRGRIDIRRSVSSERRPGVADLGTAPRRDVADLRRAVVYLESGPLGAFEERGGSRARLDQRNETFAPHVLAISAGTIVDFPNNDTTYHNVFSLSKAKRFDLGRYARGHSKSVRFDRPGIVRVFCDIHSHMSAFVLVFGHRFFAMTDQDGRYRIDDVPDGTYNLVVWYEGDIRESRPITVANGAPMEQDFAVQ